MKPSKTRYIKELLREEEIRDKSYPWMKHTGCYDPYLDYNKFNRQCIDCPHEDKCALKQQEALAFIDHFGSRKKKVIKPKIKCKPIKPCKCKK